MRSFIEEHNASLQIAYSSLPSLIKEHYGIEQTVLAGGYGYRQIMELIQNGADAILEAHQINAATAEGNQIDVLLRGSRLYVANTGAPLSREGAEALLSSHSSPKRGNQIGRFGIGFKSLLRLGGIIDIFTKDSGAIRFDPDRCRRELRDKFGVPDAPGLRLAWPLNEGERDTDPILSELAWAETVVRVEIRMGDFIQHLMLEIQEFPAEFLLFLPVRVRLKLNDGVAPVRELRVEPEGDERVLIADKESSRWHIVFDDVVITDERAIADATHIHARKTVPLAWAIPLEGKREEAGRFWAFFPTRTPTYLPGILNAPWKLNSDRNAIIGGEWNAALMHKAAALIAGTLPQLHQPTDPGRVLDFFPRQLERKDEDAAPLVEALWTALECATVIPDAVGLLRPATELWRHPRENSDLARQWQSLADGDKSGKMVHPSCLERQRGSRLNELAGRLSKQDSDGPNLQRLEAERWFDAIAQRELSDMIGVFRLAEEYEKDCKPQEWRLVRPKLRIIPTEDGRLVTAEQSVFAPEGTRVPDGRYPVPSALCEVAETKRILAEVMLVKTLDDSMWRTVLEEELRTISLYSSDAIWQSFWLKLRAAPSAVKQTLAAEYSSRICIRRRDQKWVLADQVLLPGDLVSANDDSINRVVLVDQDVHANDKQLLLALGANAFPQGVTQVTSDELDRSEGVREWLYFSRNSYYAYLKDGRRPQRDLLGPLALTLPKGWGFLTILSGTANAKLTMQFLDPGVFSRFPARVKFGHSSVRSYPTIDVSHPLFWLLRKYGTVQVGPDTVYLRAIAVRRHEPALARIPHWEQLRPALDKIEDTWPSVVPKREEVRDLWIALIKTFAVPSNHAGDSLGDLWSGAAKDNVVPQILHTDKGELPLDQVFVTGSPDLAHRARTAGYSVVTLGEYALKLWLRNGARNLAELIFPEFTEHTGPVNHLIAIIPEIAEILQDEKKGTARCQMVAGLKLVIAEQGASAPCLMWDNVLLLDLAHLSSLSRAERIQCLLAEVAAAGWLKHEPRVALDILGNSQTHALRERVAQGSTLAERLLLAVGNHAEPLRKALGNLADMDFIRACTPIQLAELALAQLGPAALSSLKEALKDEGLKPPIRWNSAEARTFVVSIGFPENFAVSPEIPRESEEFTSGPIRLPPLHDFQQEVFKGIQALIAYNTSRRRAVISLPTGGGKTRVTAEAAVVTVLKPEGGCRSVIWVAQTDELCEQAVQAFRQVWLNLGAEKTDLRIVRLWGGNPNPAIQQLDKPVVVVTSIQTLNSRMGSDGLHWLSKPGLVVVDECHHAITPSYTNLLRWLDAEAQRGGAQPKEEPPILGLSATPFRVDDEESQRLARRFDNIWLPADQDDLHFRLTEDGVLAEAVSEALNSGVGLLPEEMDRLSELTDRFEGIDFENLIQAINLRLAENVQRNECILDYIKATDAKSILLFANSVSHAEEISARLNLQGITSAAVSGSTPTAARRYFLDHFQQGEIRVLCNHTVLSTGFDAPKTDMVLISRAVFSPVRYMQMVGRGLRGVKNGGTPRCRIVTVIDNLGRFQDQHPYHYCQRYFTSQSPTLEPK